MYIEYRSLSSVVNRFHVSLYFAFIIRCCSSKVEVFIFEKLGVLRICLFGFEF